MSGPAWNIKSEYSSIDSVEFRKDFEFVENAVLTIEQKRYSKEIKTLQEMFILRDKFFVHFWNISVYLSCILSVDSTDQKAKSMSSLCSTIRSRFNQACTPMSIFIKTCDEDTLKQLLSHPEVKPYEFQWRRQREENAFLLSESEETLLESLNLAGHKDWETLYSRISGTIKCQLKYLDRTETVGLAQAMGMVKQRDPETRKIAWHAINEAWSEHRESAAAILNALAGWKIELCKKRSHTKPLHFLDNSLRSNRITKETLEALIGACRNSLPSLRKAPLLMAKILKKPKLDPWDIIAPSPLGDTNKSIPFDEAISTIREAFAQVDSKLVDFVDLVVKNQWIEGRVLPNKRTGGYFTEFEKSQTPRIYMTYMGSDKDVTTLAHELGHAYHSWVMRDIPLGERIYTMSLAESASVFAETILRDTMSQKSTNTRDKINFAWADLEAAGSYLINIPSRFEFEKEFYERRQQKNVGPDELSELMDRAWTNWYGDTLSTNDRMFWASKLHFYNSGDGNFYNYPYTFGYLFSLSIYARRKELGDNFMKTYVDILRDTGRMTAEDLVQKHLGEDIRRSEFWQKSLDLVTDKLNAIEELI